RSFGRGPPGTCPASTRTEWSGSACDSAPATRRRGARSSEQTSVRPPTATGTGRDTVVDPITRCGLVGLREAPEKRGEATQVAVTPVVQRLCELLLPDPVVLGKDGVRLRRQHQQAGSPVRRVGASLEQTVLDERGDLAAHRRRVGLELLGELTRP